ncbi:hypothetical protein quinque_015492 [Culex quinquefasciatus]
MKAGFCLILIASANFGLVFCSCNLGLGRKQPDQVPVHELHQRIVGLRGEENLTILFRYIPSKNVDNVNLTYVQFYVDLEQCSFDVQTPLGMHRGFQVQFYSPGPVQEIVGNATVYGVPIE